MKNIIEFLAQRPKTVDILIGLILVVGLIAVVNMRSNFLPPEPVNFITVNVVYRGASPQEVEEDVINKIEDKLEGLGGIDRVTSTASESFAAVRIELTEDADRNEVIQDINNAVNGITTFPSGIDTPVIAKEEILNYTMTLGVVGEGTVRMLKDYAKGIKDELILNPSLTQIFISGYPDEEIEVKLRENDLRAYQLTFEEVADAINSSNIKASGGELETGKQRILIRLDSRKYFAKDLLNITVKATPDGKVVYLRDIADVQDRFANKPDQSFVNGEPAVTLKVFSRNNEDILDNAEILNAFVTDFNSKNELFQLIIIEDRGIPLSDSISRLVNNAWQGILLVLIVLGLFLDPRIAFWVAFKIPVSLLGMFILSYFYDLTINQVSLFGTIIVLGIIVDDGVVVAENIYEKFMKGLTPLQAAIQGTIEVIPAIVSSLLTTAFAFSIFFFFDGQLGDYFSDVAFVVCGTLFVALLESLFFLPVHIARSKALRRDDKPWKITRITNSSLLRFRDKFYSKLIRFSLRFPIIPIIVVLIAMVLTIAALGSGLIKGTFFPNIDQDQVTANLELPLGTDERIVRERLDQIEAAVWEVNDEYAAERDDELQVVRYIEKVIGPKSNEGFLNIYMLEGDTRNILSYVVADKIRDKVGPIPEARNLSYTSLSAFGKPVSIALIGKNEEELRTAKTMLRKYLEKQEDLKDVTDTDKLGMPELEMTLNANARLLGFSEAQVFDQIRKGFFGLQAQSLQRGDEEVKIWVRYDVEDRRSVKDLENMRLTTPEGASYPMSKLATFNYKTNVTEINHQSGTREIRVEADKADLMVSVPAILGAAEATVLKEIKERFPRIRYTLEGEARLSGKTQSSSQGPTTMVFILIVATLMLNYRSVGKTMAILAMLPFAFVGVAWGTFIHGIPVSIFSFLGLIALWGILINNGLVLVSTYNENILRGMKLKDALMEAAISRFRPIVLTPITTVFGLAPLLLSNSVSAQFIKPTAVAIAYGLIFGLVLSLTFLPAILLLINKLKFVVHRLFHRNSEKQVEQLDEVLKEITNELA